MSHLAKVESVRKLESICKSRVDTENSSRLGKVESARNTRVRLDKVEPARKSRVEIGFWPVSSFCVL